LGNPFEGGDICEAARARGALFSDLLAVTSEEAIVGVAIVETCDSRELVETDDGNDETDIEEVKEGKGTDKRFPGEESLVGKCIVVEAVVVIVVNEAEERIHELVELSDEDKVPGCWNC